MCQWFKFDKKLYDEPFFFICYRLADVVSLNLDLFPNCLFLLTFSLKSRSHRLCVLNKVITAI